MGKYAFRDDFPKRSVFGTAGGPSWDRQEVAKALRQGRTMNKLSRTVREGDGDRKGGDSDVLRAVGALRERANRPSKMGSPQWFNDKDRDIIAGKLEKKVWDK